MKQWTVNAGCAIRQKNTYNILLHDAQLLHHLNTLIDTITRLATSIGRYVNIWGYRLPTGSVTIGTYCGHVPERVINVNSTTAVWDVPVITDRTVLAN